MLPPRRLGALCIGLRTPRRCFTSLEPSDLAQAIPRQQHVRPPRWYHEMQRVARWWNLRQEDLIRAADEMEKEFITLQTREDQNALYVLVAKGVKADDERRRTEFRYLFQGDDTKYHKPRDHWRYRAGLKRLRGLHNQEFDTTSDAVPPGFTTVDTLLKIPAMKGWNDAQTYILYRDNTSLKNAPFVPQAWLMGHERSIVTAVVMQHMLVAMRSRDGVAPMTDIHTYMRHTYSAPRLSDYIFREDGGVSMLSPGDVLHTLLDNGSAVRSVDAARIDANFLDSYGPVLVSDFQAYEDFRRPGQLAYHGEPDRTKTRGLKESFLIVGARPGGALLAQTWARSKQFVELSPSYLQNCGAKFSYVREEQRNVKYSRPVTRWFQADIVPA